MKKSKKIPYTPKYKFGGFEKTIFTPDKDDKQKMKKFGKQAGTAAYGVGEGLLDTVTMGATDQITDQGYYALQKAGNSTQDEMREQDSIRGFSNAAGAIGGAIINPGATGTAISQTGKGLGAGISKGNESKEWAAGAGMALNTAGQIGGMAYGQAGSPMTSGMQTQAGNFNASSFGQGLDKYNQYMNQGSGNGQMGGILNNLMGGGSGGMGAGFMSNLPSGTPPLAMKYGGQMKFGMGGMQYANGGTGEMNAEVEGGGYGQDGENAVAPGGQFTQFNGPTHAQGGIQTDMAPGTRIFSDKLKVPGTNKSFAKLNTSNNTNREDKLETKGNLDPKSKTSIDLTRMAKMKNSDMLFAMQEQLKKDKVAAYAKKMGVKLPSMDNEQMEPQGMSEQSEGEMLMGKYGGMYAAGGIHINPANKGKFTASAQRAGMGTQEFANHVLANKEDYSSTQVKRANFAHNAAGWKHAMGGVQLPFYNTDNAGNPIYAMGGGYPAMTNPYNNFRGSIPMYDDGGNMPIGATVPTGTTTPIPRTTTLPILPTSGSNNFVYENSPAYLAGKRANWGSTWGAVYGSNAGKNMTNQRLMSENKGLKYLSGDINKGTGLFEGPNPNDPTKTMKYFYAKTPENSYGLYPGDIMQETPKVIQDTIPTNTNISIPKKDWSTVQILRDGTHVRKFADGTTQVINLGDLEKKKYGGQMPKYEDGATVPYKINITDPNSLAYMYNQNMLKGNSYAPSVLPWNRTNDVGMGPNGAAQKYTMENPTQQFQEATTSGSPNITQTNPNSNNKPNWMDIVGKGVNFAAQNMGNIYDLSRKDAPLQSYERATGKFLDPTQARRDEQYAYRQANKAIPGLVGGSGGAAMNLLGANRAKTSTNIGRINKEYENANAQIGNQLNQFNTEIAYREAEARAKDAAMKENIRSQAIHGIGTSVGKATKSGKEDVMDQKTLEMYKQYYNNPQFRAALKKAGYDV